jgi:integrase
MATERVTVYRKYHGAVPRNSQGRPLPKDEWPRKRPFRWAVRWFGLNGTRYSRSFESRKEAERFAENKQLEVRRGRADPLPGITLGGFAAEHRQVMRGQVAWRTLQDQMRAIGLFMNHVGPETRLQSILPRHAESFIASRLASGLEPATVNKDIRTLKRLFNLAVEPRGYLLEGTNPFRHIKPRKKAEKPKRYVSPKEYRALMDLAANSWWRALLAVAYGAGLRRGEMLNLVWSDVDFEGHQIPKDETNGLLAWEPKDHECRMIPVPDEVMDLLAKLQADSQEGCPYVFLPKWRWQHILRRRGRGKWTEDNALVNNIKRAFDTLLKKAGVPQSTLHDLRRSCITNWARELPAHVVQKLAGHSDIKTTQKYYLIVRQEDMDRARMVNSKILRRVPTDPLLTHSGQNEPLSGSNEKGWQP